jgi:hypothetical protein
MINWFKKKGKHIPNNAFQVPLVVQEDMSWREALERFYPYMREQHQDILARALVKHGAACSDPGICTQEHCWIAEPDKIVGEPYEVKRRYESCDDRNGKIQHKKCIGHYECQLSPSKW